MSRTGPGAPLAGALLALVLAACGSGGATEQASTSAAPADARDGGEGAFPRPAREGFLDSCMRGATQEQCECALARYEERLGLDALVAAGDAIRAGRTPPAVRRASRDCA